MKRVVKVLGPLVIIIAIVIMLVSEIMPEKAVYTPFGVGEWEWEDEGYVMTSDVSDIMQQLLSFFAEREKVEVLALQHHPLLVDWFLNWPEDVEKIYYFAADDAYEWVKTKDDRKISDMALFEYFVDDEQQVIRLSLDYLRVLDITYIKCRYRLFEPLGEGSKESERYLHLALKNDSIHIITDTEDLNSDGFMDIANWTVRKFIDGALTEPLDEWTYQSPNVTTDLPTRPPSPKPII